MSALTVIVNHLPAPQGSHTRNAAGAVYDSNKNVKSYRAEVTAATLAARNGAPTLEGPVALTVTFTLPRPVGHHGSGRNAGQLRQRAPAHPGVKPDLDKLLRATLDGLTDGGAFLDDSRIVAITAVKAYPGGHLDALDTPGAVIHLQPQEA